MDKLVTFGFFCLGVYMASEGDLLPAIALLIAAAVVLFGKFSLRHVRKAAGRRKKSTQRKSSRGAPSPYYPSYYHPIYPDRRNRR